LRKTGYIFLLAILLIQAGGALLIFRCQQYCIQYQISVALKEENTSFEKLTLSVSEYQKNRIHSNEISYKGKMYDIRSVNFSGDKVELFVIHDSEEENILEKINDFLNTPNPTTSSKLPARICILFSLNYLAPDIENIFYIHNICIHTFHQPDLNFVSPMPDVHTPPPRLV
jgi:hypothetical protein